MQLESRRRGARKNFHKKYLKKNGQKITKFVEKYSSTHPESSKKKEEKEKAG